MIRLKLVPDTPNLDLMGLRLPALVASSVAVVASIILFFMLGLNLGIDFRGGGIVEARTEGPANISEVREIVNGLGLGDVQVQEFGEVTDFVVFFEQQEVAAPEESADEAAQHTASEIVQTALEEAYGSEIEIRRVEVVGPQVSHELAQKSTIAVAIAVALMLFYIWLRFEWQFSVGAILALVHDVLLTIGMFSVTQLEFNLPIIAALLTIVGYSMNDTVVVYDRVRENLRRYKKKELREVLNESINQTLSRTVMTSVTTLLALVSLYILGGEVLRGFTFAMIWGVLVGTYSSVFIASPWLLMTGVKRDWTKASEAAATP